MVKESETNLKIEKTLHTLLSFGLFWMFLRSESCYSMSLRTQEHLCVQNDGAKFHTEAKRCFATHDEDESWLDECRKIVYIQLHAYIYTSTCSIASLWHSGQHLCRAIGRLQVRISLGFWLFSKRRSL